LEKTATGRLESVRSAWKGEGALGGKKRGGDFSERGGGLVTVLQKGGGEGRKEKGQQPKKYRIKKPGNLDKGREKRSDLP